MDEAQVAQLRRAYTQPCSDHSCFDHATWESTSYACACPGGAWQAEDLLCGRCGFVIQASGHAHMPAVLITRARSLTGPSLR